MPRILAIDYGLKRVGIAVTDALQMIATPLDTVATSTVLEFIKQYASIETIECFVIGEPKKLDNTEADILPAIQNFADKLQVLFPDILIEWQDERFTSSIARKSLVTSGYKKSQRRDKTLIDKLSANIILTDFMIRTGKWQR
jgi:putative Holliday junction resolvase